MLPSALEMQIVRFGEKHNIKELRELIAKTNSKELIKILLDKIERKNGFNFWNFLLLGFDAHKYESREQRFACVKAFLDALTSVELNYRQTYDYVARLCQDLSSFTNEQLVEILELCMDGIRTGDAKCVGWKDLLPEVFKVLSTLSLINVNGISMDGKEYRNTTFRNLCTMRWPKEVLTPIADMFKNLNMSAGETTLVLQKFSGLFASLSPLELPGLVFQLFAMCSTVVQLMVPLLSLKTYFHRFYYKKLFADMNSNSTDFDSIDEYSDKEMREAEETILHHLNYCTQFKFNEQQLYMTLKNFICLPDVVLSPFMLSAVLTMTTANRDPNVCLSRSLLLPLLRSIIKHNEDERALADYSVWCRDSLQRKQVDLDQVFMVLVDQNKEGKDVITPGLVNLIFVLLKAKLMPVLHTLAFTFLTRFIRKRFIFGAGIVKKLCEWMIVEQQQTQFGECLTLLSIADTYTVSECVESIKYVMDFFLWIPGEQAMRMLGFILPVLKISAVVRDALIEVLRKAMNSSELETRRLAVYGFCMILKQLNNSNSMRSQMGGGVAAASMCTQHSISGYALMSQSTLGQRSNPQRHFDLLTLEIIGLLRKCFSQYLDIKCTLYENLQRAVELNHKLAPHVLQFIDWHFRSYFEATPSSATTTTTTDAEHEEVAQEFAVKWLLLAKANDEMEQNVIVYDNLGSLTLFVSHCLVIYEKCDNFYSVTEIQRLLNTSVEKLAAKELNLEETNGNLTHLKSALLLQQANFIEGLMAYEILVSKQGNNNVKEISPLFREHQRIVEALKKLSSSMKKTKKTKASDDSDITEHNATVNGVPVKRPNTQVDNIWDLEVVERFLRLLFDDIVPFAAPHNTVNLRNNCELVRYVLKVAANKVEGIRLEPDYKQVSHSKRTLKYLTDITKVIYERCIKRLPTLWQDFDGKAAVLAALCFKQCLLTANEVYKRKFENEFIKGFDFHGFNKCKEVPAMLHDIVDKFMQEQTTEETTTEATTLQKLPIILLHCLEVLYDNLSYSNRLTTESYTWLLKFCKTYEVNNKDLGYVHKLLFTQRQKTHSGAFFSTIALHLGNVFGTIEEKETTDATKDEEAHNHMAFELKSITLGSVESCLNYLYATLRKQILDVEYFVTKANNLSYKYRLLNDEERELLVASLRALERSICSQLIHIINALLNLTNVSIPLGTCMDSMIKLLMQFYICLKNLAKHLLNCCSHMTLCLQSTKFDLLLRVVGKRLPANIYALITYIEANIFQDEDNNKKRKANPKADKAKVLRETKLIPKLILCVENFNKHVILLSKKTDDRLSALLHFGVVRDFRIRSSELKAAIERTLSHSSNIEEYASGELEAGVDDVARRDRDHDGADDDETILDAEEMAAQIEADDNPASVSETVQENPRPTATSTAARNNGKRKRTQAVVNDNENDNGTPTSSSGSTLGAESNLESEAQVLKNLEAINKRARKRVLRNSSQLDAVGVIAPPPPVPQTKKRRRRAVNAK